MCSQLMCVSVLCVLCVIQNFSVMCVLSVCSSGEGITINPELLSDAVSVLCVLMVRVSLFIQTSQ